MNRAKRSPVWKMSKEEFADLVAKSKSCSEVLSYFGLVSKGGNYKTVRLRVIQDGLDTSHFIRCWGKMVEKNLANKTPLSELLVEHSSYSRSSLKKRLLADGILQNKCALCGQDNNWKGNSLVLVLDHVNGVGNDCREENLRLLCPNCNSQQNTFAGRHNKGKVIIPDRFCFICGKKIYKWSKGNLCRKCVSHKRKVNERPPYDILLKETEEMGFCAVGRKYGVSDNAIRKWMK